MLSACDMVGCMLCCHGLVCVVSPFLFFSVVLRDDSCLFDTMKFMILSLICIKEICHDACIEPGLQPLGGDSMSHRSAVKMMEPT